MPESATRRLRADHSRQTLQLVAGFISHAHTHTAHANTQLTAHSTLDVCYNMHNAHCHLAHATQGNLNGHLWRYAEFGPTSMLPL